MPFCVPVDAADTVVAGSGFADGASSVAVRAGDGVHLGSPSPEAPLRFVVAAASAYVNGAVVDRTKYCVFTATGRTGDTLTGVARESGTPQPFDAGDPLFCGPTAQDLIDLQDAVTELRGLAPTAVDVSDPASNLNTAYPPTAQLKGRVLYCGHAGERDTRWQCVRRADGAYEWEQF